MAMMSVFDTGPLHFKRPSTISSNSSSPLRSYPKTQFFSVHFSMPMFLFYFCLLVCYLFVNILDLNAGWTMPPSRVFFSRHWAINKQIRPSLRIQDIEEVRLAAHVDLGFIQATDELLLIVEPRVELILKIGAIWAENGHLL